MTEPAEHSCPPLEPALERRIAEALQGLPLRSAPPTLQSRVHAELARRAARAWWRRRVGQWPTPLRAAFVMICVGLMALTAIVGRAGLVTVLSGRGAPPTRWGAGVMGLAQAGADLLAALARAVPLSWLYVAVALILTLYAVLFVLGATAYRWLYVQERS